MKIIAVQLRYLSMALFSTLCMLHPLANAGNVAEGEKKASFCIQCHGINGITDNTNVPNIAGQNEGYLIDQLRNFRDGLRRSTPMRMVTQNLSDEDIADLAAYYRSLDASRTD